MYNYGWFTLLYGRNQHKTVNIKKTKKKFKTKKSKPNRLSNPCHLFHSITYLAGICFITVLAVKRKVVNKKSGDLSSWSFNRRRRSPSVWKDTRAIQSISENGEDGFPEDIKFWNLIVKGLQGYRRCWICPSFKLQLKRGAGIKLFGHV